MALNNETLDGSSQMDENLTWVQTLGDEQVDNRQAFVIDSLKQYASEIGRYPLLTPQGERVLFTLRDQGGTVQSLRESSSFMGTLTAKTEPRMQNALTEGRSIDDVAYLCNLRLPLKMAKKYPTYEFMDLVQNGNIGLLNAVKKFEVEQGYRFSTYAHDWIRQGMLRGIQDTGHTIRVPVHVHEAMRKVTRFENAYRQEQGAEADLEKLLPEIKDKTGISESLIKTVLDIRNSGLLRLIPLELTNDGELSLLDKIPDSEDLYQDILDKQSPLDDLTESMMSKLTPGQRVVAETRLFATTPLKLEEVGSLLGRSRQRAQQLEAAAIRKLAILLKLPENSHIGETFEVLEKPRPAIIIPKNHPRPEIMQPVAPPVEKPVNYFEKNRLLVERASQDEKIWSTLPKEAKTLLNMTFLWADETTTSEDRAMMQQELAGMLGITDTEVRKMIRHWIEVFENSF